MYLSALYSYAAALAPWWPVIAVAAVAVAAWSSRPVRGALDRLPRPGIAALAVVVVIVGGGLACAWHNLWFSDDAFISLDYARNWIEGRGLVFNPGERVEGYTNFLWVALIAGLGRLGLDLPLATLGLGLLSYAAAIVVVYRAVCRLAPERPIVSFAALATALSYPMVSFATGGLETVFCALLVLAAALAAHDGRALAAGSCAIAATMAHPDHAVFYVAIAAVLAERALAALRRTGGAAWWRQPTVRGLARYAAPFVVVYLPYFVIRWRYYGDPLPNTFYAKSGGGAYYSQGLRYAFVSALVAGALGVMPAFALGAVRLARTVFGQIVVVAVPLYLLYVVRIGGDFMTGRLVVSALPLIFVVAEVGVRSARRRPVLAALLAAPFALACLPTTVHKPQHMRWYLTDERTYWPVTALSPLTLGGRYADSADVLHAYLPDAGPELSYACYNIGYLAWRTRFHIVDMHGLIDRELARAPVTARARPGHEHAATAAYVRAKGATLAVESLYDAAHGELTRLVLDGHAFFLAQYRPDLIAAVRAKPGAVVVDMPRYLDDYAARAASVPPAQFAADLAFFDAYYFAGNADPARRAAIIAARAATPPSPDHAATPPARAVQ